MGNMSNKLLILFCIALIADCCSSDDPLYLIKRYYHDNEAKLHSKIPVVDKFDRSYDFVIIGSGPGGSVMANRLTEIPGCNVLLLEAGEETNFLADVPLLDKGLWQTKLDWQYETTEQRAVCREFNGYCKIPRGKALGGSSALNGMAYTRANRKNYNEWRELGNPGWSYDEVLRYFKKSEDMRIPELRNSTKYHGISGPLTVERAAYETPLTEAFLKGGEEIGYEINIDYNGEEQLGFSRIQSNLKHGRRCSSVKSYLRPASTRKNLSIATSAFVTKILINKLTKRAYGVEFLYRGVTYRVLARKEVILSAGTISSPQILMLSGVGPRNHLKKMDIGLVKDLKVGYNLRDHICVIDLFFKVDHNKDFTIQNKVLQSEQVVSDYFERGIGPLTVPEGQAGVAFVKIDPKDNSNVPSGEIILEISNLDYANIKEHILNTRPNSRNAESSNFSTKKTASYFTLLAILVKPKSVGRITLRSKDPQDKPNIDPNYLAERSDMAGLRETIKLAVKVSRTKAFAKFNTTLNPTPYPGCEHEVFESDEYWECAIRQVASTLHHQVGTCKMGPASDQFAVVDARLRVYGIKALRVVDASIMPTIPAAHTNAVVYMIAEKAADMVKEDWGVL